MSQLTAQPAKNKRRGTMTILVAILMTAIIGVTAIAVDGGLLLDNKRRVQTAADAAALAAATVIFQNYPTIVATNSADPGSAAGSAAFSSTSSNGFTNGSGCVVTVNIPPATGPFASRTGYAEVVIVYSQPRYFSSIWGSSTIDVSARAVAIGRWGGTCKGVICLDPTTADALDANGTGSLSVTGGASMVVDSNNATAARVTGGGSLSASEFDITGGSTGTFTGTLKTGTMPIPDPLAYLPAPSGITNGVMTTVNLTKGNRLYTLSPGKYTSMPSFQSGDVVVFQQATANSNGGIFYLDGCGFSSQGATIAMDALTSGGVMLYNNPSGSQNSQGISISGNASGVVNLSALTSGPYAGILFFQNRTATQDISISGNGSFSLTGTFYGANARLSVSGNGTATIGSQYISRTLNVTGGGNITINYTDTGTARERVIALRE